MLIFAFLDNVFARGWGYLFYRGLLIRSNGYFPVGSCELRDGHGRAIGREVLRDGALLRIFDQSFRGLQTRAPANLAKPMRLPPLVGCQRSAALRIFGD